MKIAILTSGILPVPAVQGGAVENLIDFYLAYNNQHRLHDITIYSVWHPDVKKHPAQKSEVNHYVYIRVRSLFARIRKKIYQNTHGKEYYHYAIEYFLDQALRHLKKRHYDLIVLENRPGYALKLKDETTARLVYHLHNEKLSYNSPKAKEIYDAASVIVSVSDHITRCVQAILPGDNKCVTVHNGIDLKAFSPITKREISRKDVRLSDDDFVIVFSGRINKEKGISELVDAMLRLKEYAHIRLLVLGSTFYGNTGINDSYVNLLQKKTKDIENQIIFTGFIPYSQVPDYIRLADAAVIPSVWDDPFPTTVLEAQAMGLPIIATRRGGIPEEVTEHNAILLDTDDQFVDHLTSAILDLYDHPEKRAAMAQASIEHARLFDKDTFAQQFFTAIEK